MESKLDLLSRLQLQCIPSYHTSAKGDSERRKRTGRGGCHWGGILVVGCGCIYYVYIYICYFLKNVIVVQRTIIK